MSKRSKNQGGKGALRRARLQIEELEAREVPSVSSLSGGIDANPFAQDHIVVRWLDGSAVSTPLSSGVQSLGNGTYDVNLAPGVTVTQAIDYYGKLAHVDFAQPDYILNASMVPNDTYASAQWALNAISATTAWNYTTGSARILVAVVDTGVDGTNTDLAPNVVAGYNFVNNTTNTMDDNGHGTAVAGVIGALGNNATGVAGVDWNVQIMPLKFLDATGQGYLSNAVLAVNYAVQAGARIINNSWGGGGYDAAMASAIQNAQAHGVIVVAAAGNNASNNDSVPEYPASYTYNNVVSVAATDQNNNLASFSNYGANTVDIAAPGVSIVTTTPKNTYTYYSGTSLATPYVSGALALVWSLHPNWTYTQVIADVMNNVDHPAGLNGKVTSGLLDVGKAVAAAAPPPPATTTTPPASGNGVFSSGSVNVAFTGTQTVSSSINVNQHVTIGTLTVTVNVQNAIDSNLQVTLVSPSGQQLVLFNRRGGTGANLTNTTFSDASPNAIYSTAAPFTGTVRPEYKLTGFNNQDAFGTWKLVVTSTATANSGKILSWSLNVTAATSTAAVKTASVGAGPAASAESPSYTPPASPAPAVGNQQNGTPPARQNASGSDSATAAVAPTGYSFKPDAAASADAQDDSIERLIASLFVRI